MPEPQWSTDTRLDNYSVMYGSELTDYVAEDICPLQEAALPDGKYYVHNRDAERLISKPYRPPGEKAEAVDLTFTTATYSSRERAISTPVTGEEEEQNDPAADPMMNAAEGLERLMKIGIEYDFFSSIDEVSDFDTGHYTTLSGTSQWSDYANSTPKEDVQAGKLQVLSATGREPNVLVLGYETFSQLIFHPGINAAIKYTGVGRAALAAMAALFDVDEVKVAKGIYVSSNEGQTDVTAFLVGKFAWLFHRSPSRGLKNLTFGWHMSRPLAKAGGRREVTDQNGDWHRVATHVRKRKSSTFNSVASKCGYFFNNAVA